MRFQPTNRAAMPDAQVRQSDRDYPRGSKIVPGRIIFGGHHSNEMA
jgi:hypothetical protein